MAPRIGTRIPPEYLVGMVFGKLTVLKIQPCQSSNGHNYKAYCRCMCGAKKLISPHSLKSGKTKTCGGNDCRRRQPAGKLSDRYRGYEDISGTYWSGIQAGAQARGLDFVLTIEEAWAQYLAQDRRCAFTGDIIRFAVHQGHKQRGFGTASLDRIDNSVGYEPGNVQWVHKLVNRSRNDLTVTDFIEMCRKIAAHRS